VLKIFKANQIRPAYLGTEPFMKQIKKETDDWEKVIKTLGIKVN
jgi:tripartite-type tricarboxylate transporter receptor subunit TctC